MRHRVLSEAEQDIIAMLEYGAVTFGRDSALQYLDGLISVVALLADQPRLGRERNELAQGIRAHTHRSHAIFYRIEPDEIVIVRVLHVSRDPARHLR